MDSSGQLGQVSHDVLTQRRFNVALHTVSLCTGIGGIERGLELAAPGSFKPVLYVEREISAAAVIAAEVERERLPAAPIWSDVKTLCRGSVARYLDRVGVDVITGGYPCQPFSVAGRRRGAEDPRHLWPSIAQAIERFAPSLCFFENVAGHLVQGFEEVGDDLEGMGYRVAAGLFTASEVAASHRRERLFILADRRSERPQGKWQAGTEARATGRSSGAVVGDSESIRQRSRRSEHEARERESTAACDGVFAPGRNHDWSTIRSDLHPATESPFCGLVDGISRADELRALGNAVVPHCAAVAFISLWACLNGVHNQCS